MFRTRADKKSLESRRNSLRLASRLQRIRFVFRNRGEFRARAVHKYGQHEGYYQRTSRFYHEARKSQA